MARRAWAVAAGLGAMASGAFAGEEPEARLIAVARAAGCVIGEESFDSLLPVAGLTREEAKPLIQAMVADGRMTLTDYGPEAGGLWYDLDLGLCREGTPRERLLWGLRTMGCAVDAEGLAWMVEHPLPEDGDIALAAQELVAAGEAVMKAGGLTLTPAACKAPD